MPNLNFEDLRVAFKRWCEVYEPNHGGSPDRGFSAFLDNNLIGYNEKSVRISHTTETRLAMLLSPHWFALLKAYDAKLKQYGEKVSDEAE